MTDKLDFDYIPESFRDPDFLFKESVSKAKIKEFSDQAVAIAENGDVDALDAYIQAKIYSEYLKQVEKGLKPLAEEEAHKYGKGENVMYGCTFEQTTGATKYDYSHDEVWSWYKSEIDAWTAKLKEREDMMKKAMSFSGVVDDDGVEIPPAKAVGGSAASIRVTIPSK